MLEHEAALWHGIYEETAGQDHDGTIAIFSSADEKECPPELKLLVDTCRGLQADALVLETIDHATVAAVNVYDGTYAAARCNPDAHLPSIARGLQVRLYTESRGEGRVAFLPAATVRSAVGRWERQIALVFGRQYAAALVTGTVNEKGPADMTLDDLEGIRLLLSSAIGGCLLLQKVDK